MENSLTMELYEKIKREMVDDFSRRMAALQTAFGMVVTNGNGKAHAESATVTVEQNSRGYSRGLITETFKKTIGELGRPFTTTEFALALRKTNPYVYRRVKNAGSLSAGLFRQRTLGIIRKEMTEDGVVWHPN